MLAVFSIGLWFYIFPQFGVEKIISDKLFIIYLLALISTTAAGNVINDIFDIETDKINKPQKVWIPNYMSLSSAWILYFFFMVIGLILGFYVAFLSGLYFYFLLYVIVIATLFLYAKKIKKILLFNNILIAFLIAFYLFFIFVFVKDFLKNADDINLGLSLYDLAVFLVIFSFGLNWIREIVKDVEDRIGDKATGVQTFATEFTLEQVKKIILLLTLLLVIYLMIMAGKYFKNEIFFSVYLIFAVGLSLLLFIKQLFIAQTEKDFAKIATLLKLIMLVGFVSVFLIENH